LITATICAPVARIQSIDRVVTSRVAIQIVPNNDVSRGTGRIKTGDRSRYKCSLEIHRITLYLFCIFLKLMKYVCDLTAVIPFTMFNRIELQYFFKKAENGNKSQNRGGGGRLIVRMR